MEYKDTYGFYPPNLSPLDLPDLDTKKIFYSISDNSFELDINDAKMSGTLEKVFLRPRP